MIDKNREIQVTNRKKGTVGYTLPETGVRRQFVPGETKTITFGELEKLSWIEGGFYLLQNSLVINDEEVVKELLHEVEPEYYYGEKEIKYLLSEGSLDQMIDCLNFAPDGVKSLIKNLAVEMPCNDVQKRQLILEHLHFDVDKAIELKTLAELEDKIVKKESSRHAEPVHVETETRRTSPYTVIKKTE